MANRPGAVAPGLFDVEMPFQGGADGTIRAVRNALGLDLELHRGTEDSLIIDHAEKPKELEPPWV